MTRMGKLPKAFLAEFGLHLIGTGLNFVENRHQTTPERS